MAKVKTAKDILNSTDFLEARQKAAKYISHEFQDYAFRLANDLGDIKHKGIYMKLARTVDRTLLEQAASFALGYYKEQNKGKIFMWKVQQLRRLYSQKQDMQKLDHDFVINRMSITMSELQDVYISKQKQEWDTTCIQVFNSFAQQVAVPPLNPAYPSTPKVLIIGAGYGLEAEHLASMGIKVFGIDVCKPILKRARERIAARSSLLAKLVKLIGKESFLDHSYKPGYFDGIVIPTRMWQIIPLTDEQRYLQECAKLLKPCGSLLLGVNFAPQSEQGWQQFDWQEEKYIRFTKTNLRQDLEAKLINSIGTNRPTNLSEQYSLVKYGGGVITK